MSLSLHRQNRVSYMTHQTETENQDEKCLTDKKDNNNESGKNYGGIVISI